MPRPPVKAQELANSLAERIRAGDLTPGSWLPAERQLAATHHVVRSVARRALQMLGSVGLAEHAPGSGWRVAKVDDSSDVRAELRSLRERLDAMTSRLAAVERHLESAR